MLFSSVIALFIANSLYRIRRKQYCHETVLEHLNSELVKEVDRHKATQQKLQANQQFLELEVDTKTRELRESEHNLWTAQKIESIGELAGGIALDFNSQLMCVMGYTELALLDDELSPRVRDCLER